MKLKTNQFIHSFIHSFIHISFLIVILILNTSCKEKPVEPKTSTEKLNSKMLVDEKITTSVVDEDKKSSKEKFLKLKTEHQKPFVLLKKPEEILKEYLLKQKERNEKLVLKKINSIHKTQTSSCYTIQTEVWALNKYQPFNGTIGIRPHDDWQENALVLNELKNRFGFQKLIVKEMSIPQAKQVYPSNEIIIAITELSYFYSIMNLYSSNDFSTCYIDEPQLNNGIEFTRQILSQYGNQWRNKFGPILLGERTIELADEFDDLVDKLTSTIYSHYEYYTPYSICKTCYFQYPSDQGPKWVDWKNHYGNKFNFVWISDNKDEDEYDALTSRAKNMGLDIFLYQEVGSTWNYIYDFAYWSWLHYYLDRIERKYIYVWSYIGNEDPCYDYQITSWELIDIIETNITQLKNR
ncbi:MAG: hypothetical protein N2321_04220 [Melioribacteraceae bacterium]|nr:hypothetical protein [Melioribacteraceae bacterium]